MKFRTNVSGRQCQTKNCWRSVVHPEIRKLGTLRARLIATGALLNASFVAFSVHFVFYLSLFTCFSKLLSFLEFLVHALLTALH